MAERPILFSTEMVQAILDGRKTQTRRAIKPQPDEERFSGMIDERRVARFWSPGEYANTSTITDVRCPYGVPGDYLWVRETWAIDGQYQKGPGYAYRADGDKAGVMWKSSMHMPRCASRITLEIACVRVERLQDISSEDAIKEGVLFDPILHSPVKSFEILWDNINVKRGFGWKTNPWVWVVKFNRLA